MVRAVQTVLLAYALAFSVPGATSGSLHHGTAVVAGDFQEPWARGSFGAEFRGLAIDPGDATRVWATGHGVFRSEDGGAIWALVGGDGRTGNYANCIAIDPVSGTTAYLGTRYFGVHKTVDGGATWTWLTNGILRYAWVESLATDPNSPGTVYAAAEGKTYKTTDGGSSWTALTTGGSFGRSVSVDPLDSMVLLAAGIDGVIRSTDGGETWETADAGLTGRVEQVVISALDPRVSYARSYDGGIIYKSLDLGSSWQKLTAAPEGVLWLAPDLSGTGTIYALSGVDTIVKSTDAGSSWANAATGHVGKQLRSLAVALSDPQVLYAAGSDVILRSDDGGQTWQQGDLVGAPARCVAVNGGGAGSVVAVLGGFPYQLVPGGWSFLYGLLGASSQVPRVVVADPNRADAYLVGALEGDVSWKPSTSNFFDGQGRLNSPVTSIAVAQGETARVYAGTAGAGVFRSDSCCTDLSPDYPTWSAVNAGLPDLNIEALSVDPGDPARILAGTANGGVFRSLDGGEHWTPASVGISDLRIVALAADSMGVYAATLEGGVFVSDDFGASWWPMGTTLTGVRGRSLMPDPALPGALLLGTEASGVLRILDRADTWTPVNEGLPSTPILGLAGLADMSGAEAAIEFYAATPKGLFRHREQRECVVTGHEPANQSYAVAGGTGSIAVATDTARCAWTATADSSWITFSAGSGAGTGEARYSVAGNPGTSDRTASITVGGRTTTVFQYGRGCRPLAAPELTGEAASSSGGEFTLSWTWTSPADTYEVQVSTTSTFDGATTTLVGGISTGVSRVVAARTVLHSRVRAVLACEAELRLSPWSNIVTTVVEPRTQWLPVGLQSEVCEDAVIDSSDPAILWAACGDDVYRSGDGGATWTKRLASGAGHYVYSEQIVIDPTNSARAFVRGIWELFRTQDGGATWQKIISGTRIDHPTERTYPESLAVDPGNPTNLLLGCSGRAELFGLNHEGGLFRTTNAGSSWVQQTSLKATGTRVTWVDAVAFDRADPQLVYATDRYSSFYRSTNRGVSWVRRTDAPGQFITALAADPLVRETVYTGSGDHLRLNSPPGQLAVSVNGGMTWTTLLSTANSSVRDIAVVPTGPRTIYAATDRSGVLRSVDGGVTWNSLNDGLTSNDVHSVTIDPSDPGRPLAATDDGLFRYGVPCHNAVAPMGRWFAAVGGEGTLNVSSSLGSCAWTATSNTDWITITSGAVAAAPVALVGMLAPVAGAGAVNYTVAPNTTAQGRSGTLTVAGHTVTIAQDAFVLDAAFSFAPGVPRVGEAVQFTDLSVGSPTAWAWDFGDGTGSTSQHPAHAFLTSGPHLVSLTVSQGAGSDATSQALIVVECTLSCSALADPAIGGLPLVSQFTSLVNAENCLAPAALTWSFGDGATSSEASPSHMYEEVGEYPWILTVSADDKTCDASGTVSVKPCTLTCAASVTPSPSAAPVAATFASTVTAEYCAGEAELEWTFGDGGTSTEADPAHTYEQVGSYPWSLAVTVDDQSCEQSGTVEALGPACAGVYDLVIPAAAHANGVWQSDVDLLNRGDAPASVDIALLKTSQANLTPQAVNVQVPAGEALRLPDILGSLLPATNGALAFRFCSGEVAANSRYYNIGTPVTGTFGMAVPGLDASQAITITRPGVFHHLTYSPDPKSGYRVNLGFANLSPFSVAMIVRLYGDGNTLLGTKTFSLRAFTQLQWTKIHQIMGTPPVGHGWASVETTTAGAAVLAYAMLIDNISQDPLSMLPDLVPNGLPAALGGAGAEATLAGSVLSVPPCTGPYSLIIPAAANSNSVWRSDVDLLNVDPTPASVDIALLKTSEVNLDPAVASVEVPSGQTLRIPDILGTLLPATNAALGFRLCSGQAFANSRFYNVGTAETGTFGMAVPGLPAVTAITPAVLGVFHHLSYSTDPKTGYRVNLGFANGSPFSVGVVLKLFGDAGELLGTKTFSLRAYTQLQWTKIHQLLSTPAVTHGWATVEVTTPNALIHAYAMLIDNLSNDPTYFAPVVVPK